MAQKLYLIRHAEALGASGRYIGSTDLPLSAAGVQQSRKLAGFFRNASFSACYCSPMLRTRQTAEAISSVCGAEFAYLEDLREIDFGRWEGLSFAEICSVDPELVDIWAKDLFAFKFPEGEANKDFWQRTVAVFDDILAAAGDILIVAHGGIIRAILCHLLGLSFKEYLLFDIKPARVTAVDLFGCQGVLTGLNLSGAELWQQ